MAVLGDPGWAFWGEVPHRSAEHRHHFGLARPEDDIWSRCLQFREFAVPGEMGGKRSVGNRVKRQQEQGWHYPRRSQPEPRSEPAPCVA